MKVRVAKIVRRVRVFRAVFNCWQLEAEEYLCSYCKKFVYVASPLQAKYRIRW
jgi:hypothetical protein